MPILTQGISTIVILMGLFMCVFVDWEYVYENCFCVQSRNRNNSSIEWGREGLLCDITSDTTSEVSIV
jgi:hypothetical protein